MKVLQFPNLGLKGFVLNALLLNLIVCAMTGRACGDWPAYLNGNDRVGFTSSQLDPALKLAWTYKSPTKPIIAWEGPRNTPIEGYVMRHRVDFDDALQVVMADGRAYFGSSVDHRVHCVDARGGQPLWSFYTDGPIRLAPTLAHGNVYVGSDDGFVYCLRADDGKLVWKMRVGPKDDRLLSRGEMISRWPVRTGVLIDGDTAYFGAGVFPHEMVYLCAANAKDGSVIWRNDTISERDAGRNDLSPQGYMLCNEENLYVPSGRSLPVAVSKQTGEIIFQRQHSFRADAGGVVGGTKALLGDGQVYSGGPHHFLAMDDRTGDVGASWINGRQMVLSGKFAYLLDGEKIFCVDRQEHARASQEKQKWFLKTRKDSGDRTKLAEDQANMKKYAGIGIIWEYPSDFDDVLIATDNLVLAGGMNQIVALDRHSGKKVWEQTVVGNVRGLAVDDNVLTVSTDEGHIYGFHNQMTDTSVAQNWPAPFVPPFPEDDLTQLYQTTANEILERSGQRSGFCLVLGSEQGRLAYELAIQSQLTVIGVEPDANKATVSREALQRAGIHATRVTIVNAPLANSQVTGMNELPFSNYFANLIVSDSYLLSGRLPCEPERVARHLKPCGGVAVLGRPADAPPSVNAASGQQVTEWLTEFYRQNEGEVVAASPWFSLRRGKLAGAGDWSHQYGNVANTSCTDDRRIRDGLGVLWYGDPGPNAMVNRHEAAGAPLSTNGRMFIQGTDSVMAYDAYNGTFLWEYQNPGAIRTGVFNNRETHNLAASDEALYVAVGNTCTALEAGTGAVLAEYQTPDASDGIERAWAYLAHDQGQLFGTSTIREELESHMRRRGLTVKSQTDAIFAVDAKTGKRTWTYRGGNILHTTIAVGPEHVYFIDSSLTPQQRQQLYRQDKGELKNLTGEDALKAEAEMKRFDLRLAVALDRYTGEKLWETPVNVTDTTNVSSGGGNLTLMYALGHIVLCGANANGHYWKQFLAGEFETRKLVVLDAANGLELWSKNANYMNRPAVIGTEIYAEPWAFDLHTGNSKTRPNPLTGEDSQWQFSRPGHFCGIITATPNMMFFRSGFIGYYDLYHDSGTRHFAGQRSGCWINAIPGNGLVMIPEATAGCVCQYSIASTVVLEPKTQDNSWGIFSVNGATTPVDRLGINFGGPGDRKDLSGQEWFGYPRPSSRGRLEFVFDIQPQLEPGGGWYSRNADTLSVDDTDKPWLFTSGARGLTRFELPLLAAGDPPCKYTVKLFFANLEETQAKPFEIRLQGKIVDTGVQLPSSKNGSTQPIQKVYEHIEVETGLVVELPIAEQALVSAVEVIREKP